MGRARQSGEPRRPHLSPPREDAEPAGDSGLRALQQQVGNKGMGQLVTSGQGATVSRMKEDWESWAGGGGGGDPKLPPDTGGGFVEILGGGGGGSGKLDMAETPDDIKGGAGDGGGGGGSWWDELW